MNIRYPLYEGVYRILTIKDRNPLNNSHMYFIHSIQTYASVNRKGSELQEYVLKLKDSLIKNREVLDDLKEELHCRIEELDAKYPRTQSLHLDAAGNREIQWTIHVKGKPDNLVCIISITKVRNLLGEGSGFFLGEKTGGKE